MEISFQEETLVLDHTKVRFSHPIQVVLPLENIIAVLLDPSSDKKTWG
jgi:hypothetical protein